MKSIKIIIILIFSAGVICSQTNYSKLYSSNRAKYFQDYLNFMDDDGQSRVDLFIQVPFKEIQFIKSSKGFQGGYSVTVSIYQDDKETLVFEKVWTEKITSPSYNNTISRESFNLSFRSINLVPGEYFIKTILADRESHQEYLSERMFKVKDYKVKPAISDILFSANKKNNNDKSKIIPNISRNISNSKDGLNFFFEVYTDSSIVRNIEFHIADKNGKIFYSKSRKQTFNETKTQIYYSINDTTLNFGTYLLSVILKDNDGNQIAIVTKPFFSRWVGLPASVEDIDEAIAQVLYIASPSDIEYMEASETETEKIKRFLQFWKSKDPSPGNEENQVFEEYFSRVSFANDNFSSYIKGWRTDRGMVFIILGPPNNIDRHPFEYDSKPYEVWQYYDLNKSFVFIDRTGFGDYRLNTPMYGDFYRYRN
ncbi:MAG: GWxTD domain-containing protein [Bacteroidetes bacterium]|nr:GWxTD domain-containing protein [Bacteroidota bacterium]MCH7770406.1 GWxTD domain-containing protein [Bacteroidota bacterium]